MKSATSLAALHSIDMTELEQKVLDTIGGAGARGCISDEVRAAYPLLSYSSITARFAALEKKGAIYRAGDTRRGDSGRRQQVMRLAAYAATVPRTKPLAVPKKKRSGFLKGLMYATRIVINEPDLHSAKKALRKELLKAAGK
ncbi:hypothetical protein [Massilia sp. TN1-12]|uniref:hypothetical protein n=1 Tax=Massilia paldalensis TaxID=3377675 RepID=UPI00384B06B8